MLDPEASTMTATFTPRWCRARYAATFTGFLAVTALVAGCGSQSPSETSDDGGAGDASAEKASGAPVVDRSCPQGLTAQDLSDSVDYADADVDGDGAADSISLGFVDGGEAACSAALVVTTQAGTAATALPGLQLVPPRGFVPGGAATVGDETVIAAPVSFSPRGGGEIGLFTLVDGVLTPVHDSSGQAWTIVATVDDGGGVPQSLDCTDGELSHTQVSSDMLHDKFQVRAVRYALDGTELSRVGVSRTTMTSHEPDRDGGNAVGGAGLSIFENC
jgi:hypothetical protein